MLSDHAKLALLVACLTGCFCTFWTSSSVLMGRKDLGTLRAPLSEICREPREIAKRCLETKEDESPFCGKALAQASKCEETVKRAYQNINMGGCARQIQALTICENEWCDSEKGNRQAEEACLKECSRVRQSLDRCTKKNVVSFFQRSGLEENGTIKAN